LADATLGINVGRVIHHDKVAKPFTVTIASSRVRWTRNVAAIQQEAQLDGI
jgi:Transposase DDE domain